MSMTPTLWLFIVFGVLGVFGEVVFTSAEGLIKTRRWRLNGESYVWMFPIYGLIAFLFEPLNQQIAGWSWFLRGLAYMSAIYIVEYICGALLKKLTGGHVWNYTSRFNLHGHIQLWPHAPAWFLVGLLIERYYNDMEQMSLWLSLHFG